MPTASNEGLVAVVTGGGNGIGQVTGDILIDRGYTVVYADLDEAAAVAAASSATQGGGTALGVRVDVTDTAAIGSMVDAVVAQYGRLDILVNNAGVPGRHTTAEMTDDEWDFMMGVNLDSVFKVSRAAYPHLVKSPRASIVNVSSASGLVAMTRRIGYVASKHGVIGITKELAYEWGQEGIRVNAVAPGYVLTTGFEKRMLSSGDTSVVDNLVSEVPLGRLCKPEEIAGGIAFLISEDAGYVNGHTLVIDGGLTVTARG